MYSWISQLTQDTIAVLQKSSPDMRGQSQQSSVKGDEQEVVPAVQAGNIQPDREISDNRRQTSGRGASDEIKDKSGHHSKRKDSPSYCRIRASG